MRARKIEEMGMRKMFVVSTLFLTLFLLASVSTAVYAQEPYKIGVLLATTGPYAGMGIESKLGAVLAAKAINEAGGVNGHKIELVFEDDEGNPSKGAIAARKLITVDKVLAIFGSSTNVVSHAISLIAEDLKVPMIAAAPSAKLSQGKKFVFQNLVNEVSATEFFGQYCQRKKWKMVGILHDSTEYGMDLSTLLEKWLKDRNVALVKEKFVPTASDVTPQWLSLKNKNVDGVVLMAGPPAAAAIALKNRKQLGLSIPVLGTTSLANQKFLDLAGEAAEGVVLTSYFHYGKWTKGELEFMNVLKKEAPDLFPTLQHTVGWDAVKLFANAMKGAGNNPLKIRDELEATTKYQGAVGEYNFSPTSHQPLGAKTLTTVKVQNGKFVLIEE